MLQTVYMMLCVCVQHLKSSDSGRCFFFAVLMRANQLAALSLSVLSPLSECRHLARWTNALFDWQLHPGSQFTGFSERARNANLDWSDKKFPSKWNNVTTGNSPLGEGRSQQWVFLLLTRPEWQTYTTVRGWCEMLHEGAER